MSLALLLTAAVPCLYLTQGPEAAPALRRVGFERLCVPEEAVPLWRASGVAVTGVSEAELASRERLPAPGLAPAPALASPTRAPWVFANGWRFLRHPSGRYRYDLKAGGAALAAAEAFAYGGNVLLVAEPAVSSELGAMMAFLAGLPPSDLPPVADLAVVDDGSALVGEVLNLLARRNLLYAVVPAPSARYRVTVDLSTPEWPRESAADPSGFALKVRRALTDEQRSLRLYGSEVVIGRLVDDTSRARLHLLNYGGRDVVSLRVRVRGLWPQAEAYVAGTGRVTLEDHAHGGTSADGAAEFTLPAMGAYAVVDLHR